MSGKDQRRPGRGGAADAIGKLSAAEDNVVTFKGQAPFLTAADMQALRALLRGRWS